MDRTRLDERIEALVQRDSASGDAARLQRSIIACLYERQPHVVSVVLPADRARAKTSEGVPLLHGEEIKLDAMFSNDLFGRLVSLLSERSDRASAAKDLAAAIVEHRLHPEHVVSEAFVNHPEHLSAVAARAGVADDLLLTVAQLCARPLLGAYANRLRPALELQRWAKGYCPVCGGWPTLAELRESGSDRHLRCVRCGADWPTKGTFCAFCENAEVEALGCFSLEGGRRSWVEYCDRCRGYLKAGNASDPCPPELLAIDDLASAPLDLAARARGYSRPPEPGYRLELGLADEGFDDDD